jgi:hypothetical protein
MRLRLGGVAPVESPVGEQPAEAHRNVQPGMPAVGPSLQQQDAVLPGGGEPVRQHAARAAGTDDNEVETLLDLCHNHCLWDPRAPREAAAGAAAAHTGRHARSQQQVQ